MLALKYQTINRDNSNTQYLHDDTWPTSNLRGDIFHEVRSLLDSYKPIIRHRRGNIQNNGTKFIAQ